MATNANDITEIRTRFQTEWNAAYPAIAYVFDNEPPITDPVKQTWVRLSVAPGFERRRSIASNSYEAFGRIYLQIFIPDGTTDGEGWEIAEAFTLMFRDWHSADWRIRCDTPQYRSESADGEPLMITVSMPYTAQH